MAESGANVVVVDKDKENLQLATIACAKVATTSPLSILTDASKKEDKNWISII